MCNVRNTFFRASNEYDISDEYTRNIVMVT